MANSSIWPIDWPRVVAPDRGPSRSGRNSNKVYSTLLEPHHQIVCHIQDLLLERGLTPLHRCSQCILWPQPTGLLIFWENRKRKMAIHGRLSFYGISRNKKQWHMHLWVKFVFILCSLFLCIWMVRLKIWKLFLSQKEDKNPPPKKN